MLANANTLGSHTNLIWGERMNMKQVEAFRATMLSGSMTAAAEALHTSQPNISRLIAQLERSCSFRLFERIAGRLLPTEEGTALFRDVERAFVGLDSLQASARAIAQSGTGRLRIAAVPSLSLTLLPRVVQRFRERHPHAAITIHTSDSPTVAHWAASQFCDLGLASYVGEQLPGVTAELLSDVPGVCVFPRGHCLSQLEQVTPADLAGEEFISLVPGDSTRTRIDRHFQEPAERRRLNLETPYAATICAMVGLGLGVSIVSPLVAQDYLHAGLDWRPFQPAIRFTSYLLLVDHRPAGTLALAFAAEMRATLYEAVRQWQ